MRTATATLTVALVLSALLAVPATATTDGAGASGGTQSPPVAGGTAASALGTSGSTLVTGPAALLGHWQRLSGTLDGVAAGDGVLVQRSDAQRGWVMITRTRAGRAGAFAARWRADAVGRLTLRALPASAAAASVSHAVAATAVTRLTVYAAAIATEFGPGLFGQSTACGVILTARTIGVAHTTLPCGTLVELYYRGRVVRAPVIDRGPYANGATWDLTTATARTLGFDGLDYVGSLLVGRARVARR
jgi:hypothetical protein